MEEAREAAEPWSVVDRYWLDDLPPASLVRAGEVILALLVAAPKWVHRRVERVQFLDDQLVRHRVSLDLSLPADTPPIAQIHGEAVYLAPLFLLPKDSAHAAAADTRPGAAVYSALDLVDATGCSLPLTNRRQGSRLAAAVLVERAHQLLGSDLGELQDFILRIALTDSLYEGTPALYNVLENEDSNDKSRSVLQGDRVFTELAYCFASHWPVVHPFIGQYPPDRSIIKLAYTKRCRPEAGAVHVELRKSLGWQPTVFWTRLTQIGAAASYHLEITAPAELEMTEVGLFGQRFKLGWRGLSKDTSTLRRPDPQNYFVRQPGRTSEAQMYLPDSSDRRVGAAWVKLRARRSGFLSGALVATFIISTILFIYAASARDIVRAISTGGSSSAVTALLLLPTLLAAYIARPGEHAITGRILRLLRLLLVADGSLPFIAAILLLRTHSHPSHHELHVLVLCLTWLAGVSLLFVGLFAVSNYLPRSHETWEYSVGEDAARQLGAPEAVLDPASAASPVSTGEGAN